jgi:hypothetical protein
MRFLTMVWQNAFSYLSICSFLLQLLADCLTIVVAARMGADFTADVQGAFQKFLAVVVSSLGRQYH